jgi:predicted O-methyltransferase YrrM
MRTQAQNEYNKSIPGWLGPGDIQALEDMASTIIDGTIVELGSMHGRSAYCLSTSSPTSTIYCFDYWPACLVKTADGETRENSIEVFSHYTTGCKNIVPTKIPYTENAKWDNGPVDMVFIDASHTNPNDWECIEYWLPKIKSGGVLCGHDYYTLERDGIIHYPDVVENAARLEKILNKPVTLHKGSCVWSFVI